MIEIVALPGYVKRIKRLISLEERAAMEMAIAADPAAYPVMPGAGGCRKARWARGNQGKSGGIRAVFYFYVTRGRVYTIDAYPKNEKENLTDAEKNQLRRLAKEIERTGS